MLQDWDSDSDNPVNDVDVAPAAQAAALPLQTDSRKEGLIQNLRDIYLAEEWLDANVQHTWSYASEIKESISVSKHPSANLANLW